MPVSQLRAPDAEWTGDGKMENHDKMGSKNPARKRSKMDHKDEQRRTDGQSRMDSELLIVDFRLPIDSGAIRHTAFSIDNRQSSIVN